MVGRQLELRSGMDLLPQMDQLRQLRAPHMGASGQERGVGW